MTLAADTTGRSQPGPGLVLSIITMVVGAVLGITGVALSVRTLVHDFYGPGAVAPADFLTHLDSGDWHVYVAEADLGTFNSAPQISPSEVVITGTGGSPRVPVTYAGDSSFNITVGDTNYDEALSFTIPTSGRYEVVVRADPGTRIKLGRSISSSAHHAARYLILVLIGAPIGIAGLVMLILGINRRQRARRPPTAPWTGAPRPAFVTPAGWYPDPSIAGSLRWWDGARWTEHRHQPGNPS